MADKQNQLPSTNGARDLAGSFFDNLYSQFLLRDLFAKIAPGFVAICATAYFLVGSAEELVDLPKGLSFWQGLILLALCWIAGLILQHGGIRAGLLTDRVYLLWTSERDEDKKRLHEYFSEDVRMITPAPRHFRKVRERAIVIKEACGNGSIALSYAAALLFVRRLLSIIFHEQRFWDGEPTLISVFIFIIILLSARILWRAHHYHSARAGLFRDEYIKMQKSDPEGKELSSLSHEG